MPPLKSAAAPGRDVPRVDVEPLEQRLARPGQLLHGVHDRHLVANAQVVDQGLVGELVDARSGCRPGRSARGRAVGGSGPRASAGARSSFRGASETPALGVVARHASAAIHHCRVGELVTTQNSISIRSSPRSVRGKIARATSKPIGSSLSAAGSRWTSTSRPTPARRARSATAEVWLWPVFRAQSACASGK